MILAHHLGLEMCDALGDNEIQGMWYNLKRQPFCSAEDTSSGMLVSVESRNPRDFLPSQFSDPSYTVSHSPSTSALISTFIDKATHVYSSVFSSHGTEPSQKRTLDIPSHSNAAAQFKQETLSMIDFVEDSSQSPRFGAFEIKSLAMLADEFGRQSDEYMMAVQTLKGILSHSTSSSLNVAFIVTSPSISTREIPGADASACGKVLCSGLGAIVGKVFPPAGTVCKVTLGGQSVDLGKMLEDSFDCIEQGACHLICSAITDTQTQDHCLNFCPLIGIPPGADFTGACSNAGEEWAELALELGSKGLAVFKLMISVVQCLASKIPCPSGKPCILGCGAQEACAKGCCVSTCARQCPLNTCLTGQTCVNGCCQSNCLNANSLCKLSTTDPGYVPCCTGQCTPTAGNPNIGQCPSTCTNTQTDPNNCGCCGTVCPSGVSCSAGRCGGAHPVQPITTGPGCSS